MFELHLGPKWARARLTDGSPFAVKSEDPEVLLPSNAVSVLAVSLALHRDALQTSDGIVLRCFAPESMLPAQYRLTRANGEWTSNFGERLTFGRDGFPENLEIPDKQVHVRRLREILPPRTRLRASTEGAKSMPMPLGKRDRQFAFSGPDGRVFGTIGFPPKEKDVRAAVLFLGGSGVFDREGRTAQGFDIGYSRLYSAFADHGFVTARYDKPGAGETPQSRSMERHYDAVVETAACAYQRLQKLTELSAVPKVIVGHSEGGLAALELAGRFDPACFALLATAAMPLDKLIVDQVRRQLRRTRTPQRVQQSTLLELEDFFETVRRDVPWEKESMSGTMYLKRRSRTWYQEILSRNPVELIRSVTAPLVIAQGGRDIQVPPGDAITLATAAQSQGLTVTVLSFPDLDHFFRKVREEDPAERYWDRRRRFDRAAAGSIAQAILKTLSGL
ncbi:lysophospholipase [Cereibacter sphaeroides]|uniref:alpha/beta hydrolase family protein n=1 Tax=Cereibacter sphaeroides TaxID=1063 RepID=UPI001F341E1E|nr:alpha/beta fold hydrolase [Cereibacter sphaeroides]MCE6949783.1 lysophospholipase [Cereibacter sphaeroides]